MQKQKLQKQNIFGKVFFSLYYCKFFHYWNAGGIG